MTKNITLMLALLMLAGCGKSDFEICVEKMARFLREENPQNSVAWSEAAGAEECAKRLGGSKN